MLPKCSLLKDASLAANEVSTKMLTLPPGLTPSVWSMHRLIICYSHGKKKHKCHRIINTVPQMKKGRYWALEAMAAPQQSSYKVYRPNSSLVVFSWEMFSQSNFRHSYKHWWYCREIFTREKEASKYVQTYAFSWCLRHSSCNFTLLWSNVWNLPIIKIYVSRFCPRR